MLNLSTFLCFILIIEAAEMCHISKDWRQAELAIASWLRRAEERYRRSLNHNELTTV